MPETKMETKTKKKRVYKRKNKAQEVLEDVNGGIDNLRASAEQSLPEDHREDLNTDAVLMGDVVPSVGPSLTEPGEPDIVITEPKGNALNMGNLKPRKWPFAATSPKPDGKKKTPCVLSMSSLPSRRK